MKDKGYIITHQDKPTGATKTALNARFRPHPKAGAVVLGEADLGFRNPLAFISVNTDFFENPIFPAS